MGGIILVSTLGGTFFVLTILEKKDVSINKNMIKLAAETAKYSTLLFLVYKVFTLFL